MSHYPSTIANYFLDKASAEGRALTPMQLIKLVYIAHGWHLGYFDAPLFSERVQAWKFGPVVESLYRELKQYGSGAVVRRIAMTPSWLPGGSVSPTAEPLLNSVWDAYKGFSGLQLSSMTHQPDTPWDIAWNKRGGHASRSTPISNEDIKAHYQSKIRTSAPTQ